MNHRHWQGALELGLPKIDIPSDKDVKKASDNASEAIRAVEEIEGTEDDDVSGAAKEVQDAVYAFEGMIEDLRSECRVTTVEIEELINLSGELLAALGAIWVQVHLLEELYEWCEEHATGQYKFWSYNRQWALWLKEDLDRVQFKLRWADEIEIDFDC